MGLTRNEAQVREKFFPKLARVLANVPFAAWADARVLVYTPAKPPPQPVAAFRLRVWSAVPVLKALPSSTYRAALFVLLRTLRSQLAGRDELPAWRDNALARTNTLVFAVG